MKVCTAPGVPPALLWSHTWLNIVHGTGVSTASFVGYAVAISANSSWLLLFSIASSIRPKYWPCGFIKLDPTIRSDTGGFDGGGGCVVSPETVADAAGGLTVAELVAAG